MKFVIHPAVETERLEALRQEAPSAEWINASDPAQALAEIGDADAFLGKITPELLSKAGRLRWIQAFTASLEHYIFPDLVTHPAQLTNTRGLFGDVIADQVMGYILCFARNLHTYVRRQAERRYEPVGGEAARVSFASGPGTVNDMDRATIYLPHAKLGIVGFGGIGAEIARRASAFGMTIRAMDRYANEKAVTEGVKSIVGPDELHELLAWSDFLVIAAPHTPETEGLFNATTISQMKTGSYLINIGRGAIVVLDDLVTALKSRHLAGAALDVFEVEPLPADHALWDLPQVILTPHTAGYSPIIAARHLETLTENVRRFVRGDALINIVDKALWF